MTSVCMSNTVLLRRPTYANLHKWPESEAEFVKTVMSSGKGRDTSSPTSGGFDDSISWRQMYLRSYTFSRKEEGVKDKTIKYLRACAKNVTNFKGRVRIDLNMLKNVSYGAFFSVFHRLLSCSSKVDEAHHRGPRF